MSRKFLLVALALATLFTLALAQFSFADDPAPLIGTWKIAHRPTNPKGEPCPFLPETIEFFPNQTLTMSNMPMRMLPFKTDLSPSETQAVVARLPEFKGKRLMLVKPSPALSWENTPMAYMYSVRGEQLLLGAQGWEPATYRRAK